MLDFNKTQSDIKKYIETNFTKYLQDNQLDTPNEWIDDVLDLDEHQKSFIVFYDFDEISFNPESFNTNNQRLTLELCFVCRNDKSSTLRDKVRDYATAFYNWFYQESGCNRNFSGLVDYGSIDTVNFFDAVSGSKAIKISNLTLTLNMDD